MHRSVVEFETQNDLHQGLLAMESVGKLNEEYASLPRLSSEANDPVAVKAVLNSYDPEITEAHSVKQELCRLQTLKSYLILDAERERAFDRITEMAARLFHTPIAVISLVDLGRLWFLSNQGLGDTRECPRGPHAFCAHAILSKQEVFIVPDATRDFRFKDSPLVTGELNVRFYAAATLKSPEGYKLGTCCILNSEARPQGLSPDEQANLKDLAAMAVEALADRRNRLQLQKYTELMAYEAHNLLTPLTGVQLTLSMMTEDESLHRVLPKHHMEMLTTASTSSDLMLGILKTMDRLRQGSASNMADLLVNLEENATVHGTETTCSNSCDSTLDGTEHHDSGVVVARLTRMDELVASLDEIMGEFPKQVPLAIHLDSNVPKTIVADDLKLFRSALNLLSAAVGRATVGCIKLHIFADSSNQRLVFECTDQGSPIPEQDYDKLFFPSRAEDGNLRLCLWSVANLIDSMQGNYGFRQLRTGDASKGEDSNESQPSGSIFWFSIPLAAHERQETWKPTSHRHDQPGNLPAGATPRLMPPTLLDSEKDLRTSPVPPRLVSDNTLDLVNAVVNDVGGNERLPRKDGSIAPVDTLSKPSTNLSATTLSQLTNALLTYEQPKRQRKALVIDDSIVILKSLSMALKKLDFNVSQAENGQKGLEKMMAETFDLVLCDFLMPVMDGLDCVKQLRMWEDLNRPTFRQLIVGISAHANENVAAQGLAAGMDDFKSKPLRITCLRELCASEMVNASSKQLDDFAQIEFDSSNLKDRVTKILGRKRGIDAKTSGAVGALNHESIKRQCTATGEALCRSQEEKCCLLACSDPSSALTEHLSSVLKSEGWKISTSCTSEETLRLLEIRNWDAVLVDEEMPAARQSMIQFREWEKHNRVNRQKNTNIIVNLDLSLSNCGECIPTIHPPSGFDSVIRKPALETDMGRVMRFSANSCMSIVMEG